MNKLKIFFKKFYKKNLVLLKWLFVISILLGIVVVPVLSVFFSY